MQRAALAELRMDPVVVGMVEPRGGAGLAQLPGPGSRVAEAAGRQDLDGDVAVEMGVEGAVGFDA